MNVKILYGKSHIEWNPPDEIIPVLLQLKDVPAAKDQAKEVRRAINNPIGSKKLDNFKGIKTVAIAIADLTRSVPHKIILPQIIEKLEKIDVNPKDISLIVGTGLHRVSTEDEWEELVGQEVLDKVKIISHNAKDPEMIVNLGITSRGTPVDINKHYVEADLKIVVGMIDPHQFEGYTGGAKGLAIGLGGEKLITANHSMMIDKNACLGKLKGNPAREDLDEIGGIVGIDFIVNVVLNGNKEIFKAFAGHFIKAHREGVKEARKLNEVSISSREMDIVITSPGGFPKDLNVYQAQKALATAALIVKKGGILILTAECREGVGEEKFINTLTKRVNIKEVIDDFSKREFEIGAHKAYLWCRSLDKAYTIIVSDKIDKVTAENLFVEKCNTLDEAFERARQKLGIKFPKVAIMSKASSIVPIKKVSQ